MDKVNNTLEIIAIIIAGFSLLFSIFNYFRSESIQKKNLKRTIYLNQFRARISTPIEEALEQFIQVSRDLEDQLKKPEDILFESTNIANLNQHLNQCYSKLRNRLKTAVKSNFTSHENWLVELDKFENEIFELMNEINSDSIDATKKIEHVRKVIDIIEKIYDTTFYYIENEVINSID